MAHTCPDCGVTCHCGGDIDDLIFDHGPEQGRCTHYLTPGCDAYHDPEDDELGEFDAPTRSVLRGYGVLKPLGAAARCESEET